MESKQLSHLKIIKGNTKNCMYLGNFLNLIAIKNNLIIIKTSLVNSNY